MSYALPLAKNQASYNGLCTRLQGWIYLIDNFHCEWGLHIQASSLFFDEGNKRKIDYHSFILEAESLKLSLHSASKSHCISLLEANAATPNSIALCRIWSELSKYWF